MNRRDGIVNDAIEQTLKGEKSSGALSFLDSAKERKKKGTRIPVKRSLAEFARSSQSIAIIYITVCPTQPRREILSFS